MNTIALITTILVLLGALFMVAAIFKGGNIRGRVPQDLEAKWRILVIFMLFFLAGYMSLIVILVRHLTLPTELVTGPVFFGGAVFVFIVISLTGTTIDRIKSTEAELRLLNESLEQRVAERTQELKSSHEFLRTVLDSLNDSVIIIAVNDFKIIGANSSFLSEYGVTASEIIGRTCHAITHKRSEICRPPSDVCPLLESIRTGSHASAEHVHVDRNGKKMYMEISSSPIRDKNGKITQVVHVSRDITGRKMAEERLRESEEHLKNILDSIHAGIMIIDPRTHRIVNVNAFAALMIGASIEEIIGRTCHQFICPAAVGDCPITDHNEIVDNSERVLVTADGGRIPILKSVIPVLYRGEQHLMESFIDILKLKEAEDALTLLNEQLSRSNEGLREINEELKNFAYIVSHDLRGPLVNIKGFSEELMNSMNEIKPFFTQVLAAGEGGQQQRLQAVFEQDIPEALRFIGSSVNRMDALINAILQLSRAGRRKLTMETVQLKDLVQGILNTFAHRIESRGVSVFVGALPDLVADRIVMEQIFGNLLDNAIKYLDSSRSGLIAVSSETKNAEMLFHIRDNGRGMATDDITRAFELFRRVGKQDVPGEGMGLAFVKTLVRLLGGRIWCESEIGIGSVFSFSVPVSMAAADQREERGGRE